MSSFDFSEEIMSVLKPLKTSSNGIAERRGRMVTDGKQRLETGLYWENNMDAVLSNFKDLYFQNTFLGHFVHGGADPTADCTHTAVMLQCNNVVAWYYGTSSR